MGLYDRSYMHEQPGNDERSAKSAMWYIIAANALILFFIAPPGTARYAELALHTGTLSPFTAVQLLSCGFLHANFTHLLFNMYGLYLFGSIAAPILGKKRFLTLYFAGIILSSLVFYIVNMGRPMSLVGASGAICAVTIAAAMVDPEKQFLIIFMPFSPIKITTMVVCYTILNFFMSVNGSPHDPTSYLAHLAGFIAGYLLMKIIAKDVTRWDPLKFLKSAPKAQKAPKQPRRESSSFSRKENNYDTSKPVSNAELDELLDKISTHGINSLSDYEIARLRQARKEMRGE